MGVMCDGKQRWIVSSSLCLPLLQNKTGIGEANIMNKLERSRESC